MVRCMNDAYFLKYFSVKTFKGSYNFPKVSFGYSIDQKFDLVGTLKNYFSIFSIVFPSEGKNY